MYAQTERAFGEGLRSSSLSASNLLIVDVSKILQNDFQNLHYYDFLKSDLPLQFIDAL